MRRSINSPSMNPQKAELVKLRYFAALTKGSARVSRVPAGVSPGIA